MTLQEIYSKIPRLNCIRKCSESCGPIPLSPAEADELVPKTAPEHLVTNAFPIIMFNEATNSCPHLSTEGSCAVYENRPLICRLYGVVKAMRCPYGCKPLAWLRDEKARQLLDASEESVLGK